MLQIAHFSLHCSCYLFANFILQTQAHYASTQWHSADSHCISLLILLSAHNCRKSCRASCQSFLYVLPYTPVLPQILVFSWTLFFFQSIDAPGSYLSIFQPSFPDFFLSIVSSITIFTTATGTNLSHFCFLLLPHFSTKAYPLTFSVSFDSDLDFHHLLTQTFTLS